jgi:hypothetical protein
LWWAREKGYVAVTVSQAWPTIIGAGAVILSLVAQSMLARRFANRKSAETVAVVEAKRNETAAQIDAAVATTTAKLDDVHEIVNGTAAEQVQRIDQLEKAITDSGATVPATKETEAT